MTCLSFSLIEWSVYRDRLERGALRYILLAVWARVRITNAIGVVVAEACGLE